MSDTVTYLERAEAAFFASRDLATAMKNLYVCPVSMSSVRLVYAYGCLTTMVAQFAGLIFLTQEVLNPCTTEDPIFR